MGTKDVRQALEAMEADDSVRERFEAGDFAAVEGLDLSTDEQLLVQDAASDMPGVSGFAGRHLHQVRRRRGRVDPRRSQGRDPLDVAQLRPGRFQVADRGALRLQVLTNVVADLRSDHQDALVGLEPARLLADPDGCAAFTALVTRLRSIGYDGSYASAAATDAARAEPLATTALTDRGFVVTTIETRVNETTDFGAWAAQKVSVVAAARHVVVDLRRPT